MEKLKALEKLKTLATYVFKSNPITFFAGVASVVILVLNGATKGAIANTLLGWLEDPTAITTTFYALVGGLGLFGAVKGGVESNADASERKSKCAKKKAARLAKQAEFDCEFLEQAEALLQDEINKRKKEVIAELKAKAAAKQDNLERRDE